MTAPRSVLVLGSGKRVREAALPALLQLEDRFTVRAVVARTRKTIEVRGQKIDVIPIAELTPSEIASTSLISCAVSKDAVPKVLALLTAHDVSHVDLLIDTPVVRFKHFRHVELLRRFRNVWVAEDTSELPWLDTVREAVRRDVLGKLTRVDFHRSAYAYHGIAMAKAVLGGTRVVRGGRRKGTGGTAVRELHLDNGTRAVIIEPRDYAVGHIEITGERATASDHPARTERMSLALEPLAHGTELHGFRLGPVETKLDAGEIELARGDPEAARVTARMDSLKRVGFYRLLRRIDAGDGAYPLDAALEDTVVDYWLERLGMWRDTPVTSPRSTLGRALLRGFSRIAGT
jgi:hypothetical protein